MSTSAIVTESDPATHAPERPSIQELLPPVEESRDLGKSNRDIMQDQRKEDTLVDESQQAPEDGPGVSKGHTEEKVADSKDVRPRFEKNYEEAVKKHPDIKLKDTNGWSDLSKTFRDSDEREGREVNENVDTILVFSGLFSAVIITLVVEASKLLQRDQAEATTAILLHISQQLSSFAVMGDPSFINSTTIPAVLPPFTPDTKSKWVNALWLAALVLSLITTSLGMLVKQWFREYLTGIFVAPRERCRVRYFRRVGLLLYKVPEIAGVLPLLLQLALILFFMGLVIYIRILLPSLCWHIIALIGLWFLFFIVTTLIPLFSPSCPYKTPFLKNLFFQFRHLSNLLYDKWNHINRSNQGPLEIYPVYPSPPASPKQLFEEEIERSRMSEFDADILLSAYDSTKDIDMWEMIMRCVDLKSPRDTLATFSKMVERKFGSPVMPWSNLDGCYEQTELRCLLKSITTCMHQAFQLALSKTWKYPFERVEADAVVTLERLMKSFRWEYSSDEGIGRIARMLVEESWLIPGFDTEAKLKVIPSLIQDDPSLRRWTDSLINNQSEILVSDQDGHPERIEILPNGLHEVCRILFICVQRTPEHDPYDIRWRFPQLTARLAEKLTSFEEPTGWQDPSDVFRWQCLLDMAMKLHKRMPDIIHRSLFEALHVWYVKMFELAVETGDWLAEYVEREAEGTSQMPYGPAGGSGKGGICRGGGS